LGAGISDEFVGHGTAYIPVGNNADELFVFVCDRKVAVLAINSWASKTDASGSTVMTLRVIDLLTNIIPPS